MDRKELLKRKETTPQKKQRFCVYYDVPGLYQMLAKGGTLRSLMHIYIYIYIYICLVYMYFIHFY